MFKQLKALAPVAVVPLVAAAGLVQADTRAVYDTPDGEFVVEYRDDNNLRLGLPGEGNHFLLVEDGDAYTLGRDDEGWYAISADDLSEMGGGTSVDIKVEALNEQDEVAGVVGERYRILEGDSWADDWEEVDQVVLSDDGRLRGVAAAFHRISELFDGVEEDIQMAGVDEGDIENMALLRSSDMELTSFDSSSIPDQNFTLPPDVRHRDLRAEMQAMEEEGIEPEEGDDEPGWLGRQIRGTGEDARDDAAGETRGEIRERARDGVRSLFD